MALWVTQRIEKSLVFFAFSAVVQIKSILLIVRFAMEACKYRIYTQSDIKEKKLINSPGLQSGKHTRDLWTWPPWVICAPAFNHKIKNAAHSGVSEVLFVTNSRKRKKWTTWRLLCEVMRFWRSPTISDGSDHNRNNTSSMWPYIVLTVFCHFLAVIFLRNKACVCLHENGDFRNILDHWRFNCS